MPPRIAVLIPCLNEESSIGSVVRDFLRALPGAVVYVYDNNSTDHSCAAAEAAGAVVRHEARQGKGFTVRRMFQEVEADVYVLVDGDDTYDAGAAPGMVERLGRERLDMVVARRVGLDAAYRAGHRAGNTLFSSVVSLLFGRRLTDLLSGYRVFSRRFVKSFAGTAGGFEIETEIAVHALARGLPFAEVDGRYRSRGAGSVSKLKTWGDGLRISRNIARLVRKERPALYFAVVAVLLLGGAWAVRYLVGPGSV